MSWQGLARRLPRDPGHAVARDGSASRSTLPVAAAARPRGRDARGRAGDVHGRGSTGGRGRDAASSSAPSRRPHRWERPRGRPRAVRGSTGRPLPGSRARGEERARWRSGAGPAVRQRAPDGRRPDGAAPGRDPDPGATRCGAITSTPTATSGRRRPTLRPPGRGGRPLPRLRSPRRAGPRWRRRRS